MTPHQLPLAFPAPRGRVHLFDGETVSRKDAPALTRQLERVFAYFDDGKWHTLFDAERDLGIPHGSISARLRDLRKQRFGAHTVKRARRIGTRTYEYKLIVNEAGRGMIAHAAPATVRAAQRG